VTYNNVNEGIGSKRKHGTPGNSFSVYYWTENMCIYVWILSK